jgi:hypothetical protein
MPFMKSFEAPAFFLLAMRRQNIYYIFKGGGDVQHLTLSID